MASLKSLAKDTAIYGLSSIVGRFLNYLLVPLYTARISAASGGVYALGIVLVGTVDEPEERSLHAEGEDDEE